jgi:hypothetical protein
VAPQRAAPAVPSFFGMPAVAPRAAAPAAAPLGEDMAAALAAARVRADAAEVSLNAARFSAAAMVAAATSRAHMAVSR